MTPGEFETLVNSFSETLARELPQINEKVAQNAYALMKNRVVNDGTIGENKSLGTYSDNELPSFFFKDKSANGKGESFYLKAKKEGRGISYKEWREANNRPTDHVTLSFTGTTLNDIGVIKSLVEGTKVITLVGAKNTKTRAKGKSTSDIGGYLKDQYGDFLQPNNAEIQILEKSLDTQLNVLIKNFFK